MGAHGAGFGKVGVVVLRAAHARGLETRAELDALDGRYGEQRRAQTVLHAAEHGIAKPGRQARHGAFHDAADRIPRRFCLQDQRLHGRAPFVVKHGKGLCRRGGEQFGRGKLGVGRIRNGADRGDVRADGNPLFFEPLQAQAARRAQGQGQPAGKRTAAAHVVPAAVLDMCRIVAVAGPGHVFELAVVRAVHIGVFKQEHKRRAAGFPVRKPGHTPGRVGLPPARRKGRPARRAARQEATQRLHIRLKARREPLDHTADRRRVRLPEYGDFQTVSKAIRHRSALPVSADR